LSFYSTGDDTDKTPAPSSRGIFADKTTFDKLSTFQPFNLSTLQPFNLSTSQPLNLSTIQK